MNFMISIVDKCGYPIFRINETPRAEHGDSLRLQNYAKNIVGNLRWAFGCHEKATDAVRRKQPGAKGMDFGTFARKIISSACAVNPNPTEELKKEVSQLLDKLDPNDETVKKLKQLCYVEKNPEVIWRMKFCNGS